MPHPPRLSCLHPLRLPVSACSCLCCPASVCACLRLPRLTCAPAAVCFTCEFCFLAAICAGELFPDCSFLRRIVSWLQNAAIPPKTPLFPGFAAKILMSGNKNLRPENKNLQCPGRAGPGRASGQGCRAGQLGCWDARPGRAAGMLGCKARQGIWNAGQLGRAAGWDAGQGSWVGMLGRASGR